MVFGPKESRSVNSAINIVPLIGVLAALVVVFLVAAPPQEKIDHQWLAAGDLARTIPREQHTIYVKTSGLLDVDGIEMPVTTLKSLPWLIHSKAHRLTISLSAENEATYQEFTDVRAELHRSGVADDAILLTNMWTPVH